MPTYNTTQTRTHPGLNNQRREGPITLISTWTERYLETALQLAVEGPCNGLSEVSATGGRTAAQRRAATNHGADHAGTTHAKRHAETHGNQHERNTYEGAGKLIKKRSTKSGGRGVCFSAFVETGSKKKFGRRCF